MGWLKVGAQPTNTVRTLLRHTGVTVKYALFRQGKSEEEADQIFNRWRADKDGKPKKKVISVDIAGNPLEPVPAQGERKGYTPPAAPKPKAEPEAEVEETPAEEAPAEEAAAEEAEEAPAAEEAAPEEAAPEASE